MKFKWYTGEKTVDWDEVVQKTITNLFYGDNSTDPPHFFGLKRKYGVVDAEGRVQYTRLDRFRMWLAEALNTLADRVW